MSRATANSSRKKIPKKCCSSPCSIEKGMTMLSGKWKPSILWHLRHEPMRFNDLARLFKGASKKMIDQRLKEMESHGLVERSVISTKPLAVSYSITESGRSALTILKVLKQWVEERELLKLKYKVMNVKN